MALKFLNNGYFAGKVGIGVANPGVKLQVLSASEQLTSFSSSVADQLAYSQINASSSTTGTITAAAALELVGQANASGHGRHAWIGAEGTSNTTFETKLKFKIRGDASGYDWSGSAEAPTIMTLEGTGNVGIGTTSPDNKLEVFAPENGDGILIQSDPAGVNRAPALHLNPTAASTNGRNWAIAPFKDVAQSLSFSSSNAKGGNAYNAGTTRMLIDGISGNVGIGTTSPGAKLEISHGGINNGLLLENTLNSSNYQIALNIRENEGLIFQRWIAGAFNGNLMRIGYTGAIKFDAYDSTNNTGTPTYLLGTDASGNVVKTLSTPGGDPGPYLPLTGGTLSGALNITQTTSDFIDLTRDLTTDQTWRQAISGAGSFSLYDVTRGADVLVLNTSGNVGIGTTAPLAVLSIGSGSLADGNVPVQISTSGGTSQRWFGVNKNGSYGLLMGYLNGGSIGDGGAGAYIRNITEDPLYFMVSNSDLAMTIISNKNVGIGTTSPSEKLDVAGNIKIQAALLSNQENTNVDTGTEAIASVVLATYTAAFFDFVIKKGTNVRSGTVYACHDGTSVAFTETSTQDLGDTSDVTLNVVISTIYLQLQATTTSDDWIIKSLIRAI